MFQTHKPRWQITWINFRRIPQKAMARSGHKAAEYLFKRMEQEILLLLLIVDLVEDERKVFWKIANSNVAKSIWCRRFDLLKRRLERLYHYVLYMSMAAQVFSSSYLPKAKQCQVLFCLIIREELINNKYQLEFLAGVACNARGII